MPGLIFGLGAWVPARYSVPENPIMNGVMLAATAPSMAPTTTANMGNYARSTY
jgi:hypothetical protein